MNPSPPLTPLENLRAQLSHAGWAVLDAASVCELTHTSATALRALQPMWASLPPDLHLRDGGRYRRRRHGCFTVDAGDVIAVPARPMTAPLLWDRMTDAIDAGESPRRPRHGAPIAAPTVKQVATTPASA